MYFNKCYDFEFINTIEKNLNNKSDERATCFPVHMSCSVCLNVVTCANKLLPYSCIVWCQKYQLCKSAVFSVERYTNARYYFYRFDVYCNIVIPHTNCWCLRKMIWTMMTEAYYIHLYQTQHHVALMIKKYGDCNLFCKICYKKRRWLLSISNFAILQKPLCRIWRHRSMTRKFFVLILVDMNRRRDRIQHHRTLIIEKKY